MGHARHIGRVGALAVALGIGTAIATSPGAAWATPSDSPTDSSADADTSSGNVEGAGPAAPSDTVPPAGGESPQPVTDASEAAPPASAPTSVTAPTASSSASTAEVAPGVIVSSSGGAHTSSEAKESRPKRSAKSKSSVTPSSAETSTASAPVASRQAASRNPTAPPAETSSASVETAPVALVRPAPNLVAAEPVLVPQPTAAKSPATSLASVLAAVLAPFAGSGPLAPGASPALWVLAAAARRQFGPDQPGALASIATVQATSQPLAATAAPPNCRR